MNVLLWLLQILLALWNIIGGLYLAGHYQFLANASAMSALPKPAWTALAVLQVLFGFGLVLPGVLKVLPKAIPVSAICLAVIALLGAVLYSAYSGFPGILWAVVPAVLAASVAYGRSAMVK